ncbi:MAG: hydrogenase formation protein HypD, partial [Chitinophagaceae bacterium]
TTLSLLEAKAKGADVRILYSPIDAIPIARENPDKEVVFFAVGFETTAPANALSVVYAQRLGLKNYSILTSHVLVPPAIDLIMQDKECIVDGLLGAGHVCTIMGIEEYEVLVSKYKIPIVITGFEPVDLLEGIFMVVQQLEKGEYKLENQYSRVVKPKGNPDAQKMIKEVFQIADRSWRGIGNIPDSGYEVKTAYQNYDANIKFDLKIPPPIEDRCLSGDIMKGKIKPYDCSFFGKECTPLNPLGAPMVSSEGACAAYYNYQL